MKNIFLRSAVTLITLTSLLSFAAFADRDLHDTKYKRDNHKKSASHLRLDKRYRHNHFYPREGHIVRVLPRQHRQFITTIETIFILAACGIFHPDRTWLSCDRLLVLLFLYCRLSTRPSGFIAHRIIMRMMFIMCGDQIGTVMK